MNRSYGNQSFSDIINRFFGHGATVTYSLMGVTILVGLLQGISSLLLGYDLPALLGMKINEYILAGEVWRLITPVLLHGSLLHIGFNMYALFIFGPALERDYGHWRFLAMYLLSAFGGNVLSFLFSSAPSLGASTAIFGLIGAQGMLLYMNREILGERARFALNNVIMIAVVNLLIGFTSARIDNWGHIGGLLAGGLFAWTGGPLFRVEGIYPPYRLVDERDTGDALRAGLSVGGFFVVLVLVGAFMRLFM
jgi:rhomboid protease GluP